MSTLATWGLDGVDELVYRAVLRHPGRTRDELAGLIGRGYEEVVESVRRLGRLHLVEVHDSRLLGAPPGEVFADLLAAARGELLERERQLVALRQILPSFVSDYSAGEKRQGAVTPVEVVAGQEAVNAVLAELSGRSDGELLTCVRPPMAPPPPGSPERARTFSEPEFAAGRPSRTVYRADLFEDRDWWHAVREMAHAGADIRVAGDVPTKLIAIPDYAAMVPLDFDTQDGNNGLLVREPALVNALSELFELVWERAVPLSAFASPAQPVGGRSGQDVLGLLAAGAKDETIARQLDLSLRTVRRHVAGLLDGLDARTRFQAGVQAVRRGWL